MSLKRFLKNLLNDDRGQSTTEYILILAIVVMIAKKFKGEFVDKFLTGLISKVQQDAETATN